MDTLLQDLRIAVRSLRRSPGFALVAIVTLGVGIGAATALFSVASAVLLRPLPYPEANRVMQVWQVNGESGQAALSEPNFRDLREAGRSFESMARYAPGLVSAVGGTEPARVTGAWVSQDFFRVLAREPARGRLFAAEEQREGGAPAVIVSHAFWQQWLGGDAAALGRTLTFDGRVHTVVGVMPEGFAFPAGTDLWAAAELDATGPSRTAHNWRAIGRLRPGATPEAAQAELGATARRLRTELGDDTWMTDAAVVPLHEETVGAVRPALLLLLAASGVLLLIAIANVANLLLARAAVRRRELAVRTALGAGRARLVRQFLAESAVLCGAGGALGALLATWGVDAVVALEPAGLPRLEELGVSGGALAFAVALSAGVAVALGLLAALRSTGTDVRAALAEGERGQSGGAASRRLRGGLVVAQVAMTLVLLVGAGLLGRSFLRLLGTDPGFRTGGAAVMSLALPGPEDDAGRARLTGMHEALFARLRALPGVAAVGGVNELPLASGGGQGTFLILSRPDEVASYEDYSRVAKDPSRVGEAEFRVASADYFRAMQIPLLRGRAFEDRDAPGAPHVAVISESLARTRWPGEDPMGKLIQFGNMDGELRAITVVGVVGDVREQGLDAEPRPTLYVLSRQRPNAAGRFHIVIAGQGDPSAWTAPARAALREVAPDVPPRLRLLEEVFAASTAARRFSLLLIGAFGAAALLLATTGVYGVISYVVAQRTREFGIRMALGAHLSDVLRLVVRQGMILALGGIALGLAASLAGARLVESMLFGVAATDVATFVAVPLGLAMVTLAACLVPARRAARVSPLTALRSE